MTNNTRHDNSNDSNRNIESASNEVSPRAA